MTDRDGNLELALFAAMQVRSNAVRLQERLRQEAELATGDAKAWATAIADAVGTEITNADVIIDNIEKYQDRFL